MTPEYYNHRREWLQQRLELAQKNNDRTKYNEFVWRLDELDKARREDMSFAPDAKQTHPEGDGMQANSVTMTDLSVADLKEVVASEDDPERLAKLRELEEEGSNRVTALRAIDDRIEELEEG